MNNPLDFSDESLLPRHGRNRKPEGNTRGILICAILGVLCLMTLTYALAVAPWLEKRRLEREREDQWQQYLRQPELRKKVRVDPPEQQEGPADEEMRRLKRATP